MVNFKIGGAVYLLLDRGLDSSIKYENILLPTNPLHNPSIYFKPYSTRGTSNEILNFGKINFSEKMKISIDSIYENRLLCRLGKFTWK